MNGRGTDNPLSNCLRPQNWIILGFWETARQSTPPISQHFALSEKKVSSKC